MSRAIKLKNNDYIDSTGVTHDRVTLDKYLKMYTSIGTTTNGTTYPYRKLLSFKLPYSYQTVFLKFVAVETENTGFIFNGEILAHVGVDKTIEGIYFLGNYSFKNLDNMKMVCFVENNTAGNVTISLYAYIPYNWRTIKLFISSAYSIASITSDSNYSSSEPPYYYKKEI
ncbi:MAG: hypothetical protein ACI4OP_06120 [Candidatus Coprovivens sp.]